MDKECNKHGITDHRLNCGRLRCKKCASEAVSRRRRKLKELLVLEFGGKCKVCGYDTYIGCLDFHHIDDESKDFSLSGAGITRSLENLRKEAQKCVLVCCRCHREIHAGLLMLA